MTIIAPHHCCECGQIGMLLCDNCKYNIISEPENVCLACGKACGERGICSECRTSYDRAWHVGKRADTLQRLIGLYKFERARSAYRPLASLLDAVLPQLPGGTVLVPVPTVSSHIRQRGYDHTLLVVKRLASIRGLKWSRTLNRQTNTMQRHASARLRKAQAKEAFTVNGQVDPSTTYLLIDDVTTTGATLQYAAKTLKDAGANNVWVAGIARQALD